MDLIERNMNNLPIAWSPTPAPAMRLVGYVFRTPDGLIVVAPWASSSDTSVFPFHKVEGKLEDGPPGPDRLETWRCGAAHFRVGGRCPLAAIAASPARSGGLPTRRAARRGTA